MSISTLGTGLSPIPPVGLSVGLSVWKVYCGKMADWIQMPFEMMSRSVEGWVYKMGMVIVKGEGALFGVNMGIPL